MAEEIVRICFLDFSVDGIIVNVASSENKNKLGFNSASSNWALAFKNKNS
tara:strand:- start:1197 stop:1346 length:150 start_codon:yes stop_codon:yes gene_type:complete